MLSEQSLFPAKSGARWTRRAVLRGGAAGAAGSGLAACAVGGSAPSASESAAKAPATIVYWCNVGQSDWEKIQQAAIAYGKKNPQHKIESTNDPGAEADYGAKLI